MTALSKSSISYAAVFSLLIATILCVIASTFANACGFDDTIQQQQKEDNSKNTNVLNLPPEEARRAGIYEQVRIAFSTLDLDVTATSKYCTAAGDVRPDFKGGTRTCTDEDVLTTAKRTELIDKIIPAAIAKLQNALRVIRLPSNLMVGSTSQCTGGFTIPSAHVSTGVANADYIIYVAAGPTAVGNVAFAASCQNDGGSPSRSIVGRVNFGPYYLSQTRMPRRDAINTMVHEILHAFGFSSSAFVGVQNLNVRGISKSVITAARPKAEAQAWMGCGSLPGVELENEGGAGTAGSHVDARVYPDDIMAGAGGEALSVVTLAIMESLGVYSPFYNASENMITGKGLGCAWAEGACTDPVPGSVYCPTVSASDVQCTGNLKAYGPCSNAFLTDDCNYYNAYSNKKCYDVSQADSADSGDTFDPNSRCFKTTGTFKKNDASTTSSQDKRCLKSQCYGGILAFTVGRDSVNFVTCQSKDQQISYSGYQGAVVCPNITRMCDALQSSHNGTENNEALNPIVPTTRGKTNRASDYVYTTKLTLTLSGTGWGNVIKKYYSDLFVAMQGDVAQVLNLQTQQVWVMSVTGTGTQVQFVININDPARSTTAIRGDFAVYQGRRAWMPRTADLYASKSNSGDNAVLGAAGASDKPENACTPYMPSFEDTDQCNGFIAGLVIAAVAFLSLIVVTIYCCCCKYQDPPTKTDRSVKYEVRPRRNY